MKTAKEWCSILREDSDAHPAACCCDRCKDGYETFLLPSDITDIQEDALLSALICVVPGGNPEVARERITNLIYKPKP